MFTLSVATATLSINTLTMIAVNKYTENYRVDTNGCCSNALSKHFKMMVLLGLPNFIVSTLRVAVATVSVNTLKIIVVNIYTQNYSVDTNDCSSNA